MKEDGFKTAVVPITYYKNTKLERAIERLFVEADRVYREGANILIDPFHIRILFEHFSDQPASQFSYFPADRNNYR